MKRISLGGDALVKAIQKFLPSSFFAHLTQLFLTTLWRTGTGLPCGYRIGPGTASEHYHLREMLHDLPEKSRVVADAGFTGYDLLRSMAKADQFFLVRVGSNVHLLKNLGYFERQGEDTV